MIVLETHIVPAMDKMIRLQEYAPSVFKSITTRSGIKKAIKRKEIFLDGKIAKTSDYIRENQILEILQPEVQVKKIFKLQLEVIYEDDFLAVINKPAGFPTSGNYFKTIENSLPYNLLPSAEIDALPFPTPVHRLDSLTSGLLLIAKTRKAQVQLHQDFENKNIQKVYIALVHGKIPDSIDIDDDIDQKPSFSQVRRLDFFQRKEEEYSLVEVRPKTGRTHQIRLHLSGRGFPIVGDKIYGQLPPKGKRGMYLAAIGLLFIHPVTGEEHNLQLPYPKKFRKF